MSEALKTHEVLPKFEELELPEHATPDKQPEKATVINTQEVRQAIAEIEMDDPSDSAREQLQAAEKPPQPASSGYIDAALRQVTLRRELQAIRRKLPAPQRALSRVIHQPVVRLVSEGVGKTVSRPSGLLGGGLMAFIGSSGYLYLSRHIGFRYNYLVFLLLFAGGFALGLLLEFLVYVTVARRHKTSD